MPLKLPVFCSLLAALVLVLVQPQASYASEGAVKQYVDNVAKKALTIISTKVSKDRKQQQLERLFADSVDTKWIGRFVVGRFWRQANGAQQTRYLNAYRSFLLSHYTSRFSDLTGGSYEITGVQAGDAGEYTASMKIMSDKTKDEPVLVDYRLRKGDSGGFKIFDVIVEGVSLITTQRSEFSSVLNQGGIEELTSRLEKKTISVQTP